MRAISITRPGGPDVLRLAEVADPVPGPGEVLISVTAAGVNRADLLQREGHYPPPPGAPPYPGLECSGRICATGPGVTGWRAGDEVCAVLVAVPVGQVLPVPRGVPLADAAGLPEVACTVYSNVFQLAGLRPGETLLVHGGASGIGTMAIQLAHALGARVAATAGSPAKLARCRELGADLAIRYPDEDFTTAIAGFTGGAGADVILDIIGAAYLARNLSALATGGRLVVIGLQGGAKATIDLNVLMRKRASLHATSLRARPPAQKAEIVASVREHVWPLIESGKVVPVTDSTFPLADAAEAHRAMAAGRHVGKLLLIT